MQTVDTDNVPLACQPASCYTHLNSHVPGVIKDL